MTSVLSSSSFPHCTLYISSLLLHNYIHVHNMCTLINLYLVDTKTFFSIIQVCQVGMGRTYTHSQEGVVDEKRREFLFERCGSRSSVDCTHRDLAQDDSGDCECDMIPTSLLMNQSGDLDGTCDEQAKTGNPKYVRSVVATCKAQLHHLSTTLDNPSPDKLTPPRPVTDLSLRQGEHEESPREKPSSPWITGFRPRDPKEVVRNCSHVNLEVKKVIVDTLTRHLLQTENYIIVGQFQSGRVSSEVGQQPLSSAVSLISTMQQKQPHKQLQQQLGEDPTSVNESGKSLRSAETSHKNIDDDDDGNVSGDGELKSRRVCGCLRDQRESVATAVNVVGRSGGCNDGDRSCLSAGDCLHREALLTENTITCISKEHTHCETVKWNLGGLYFNVCVCQCLCITCVLRFGNIYMYVTLFTVASVYTYVLIHLYFCLSQPLFCVVCAVCVCVSQCTLSLQ